MATCEGIRADAAQTQAVTVLCGRGLACQSRAALGMSLAWTRVLSLSTCGSRLEDACAANISRPVALQVRFDPIRLFKSLCTSALQQVCKSYSKDML